ncbi:MAG: DUF4258 domain-containing protein [Bacteroidetes bacterium]|nr:DUF4258 domain-containing protein [Bacteroidota bacterium]
MLKEREISEEWLWRTVNHPDWQIVKEDDNVHYFKCIPENRERILHVVVNPNVSPQKVVTVFFDRRERKQK